jgi:predicted DNA binding CopG/RHH family protein
MPKKVVFEVKSQEQPTPNPEDNGVKNHSTGAVVESQPTPTEKPKLKRLTLDIPEQLHRSIKGKAAQEGVAMVDMLRDLLEDKYGKL